MIEHEPQFSDAEMAQIRASALELAKMGDDAVWESAILWARLEKAKAFGLEVVMDTDSGKIELTYGQVVHKAAVVGETVRQARAILMIEGNDDLGILDNHCKELGLGSIFDPSSKAGGVFKDSIGRSTLLIN